MVQPTHFCSNAATALDNHFMKEVSLTPAEVNAKVVF